MGRNCKVQNYALVYEPARLEDGVFVGPAAVFTNDHYPRSVAPDGSAQARATTGKPSGVTCPQRGLDRRPSVCVAPVTIGRGRWSPPGRSSSRTCPTSRSSPVSPARRIGWVGALACR
jgi:UDP-2-acetamido-3-amino-2,3-dideoxy-glucuronate N-acetyltransferase